MKKTETITLTGAEAVIAEARGHAEQATAALRKGCEHALLAGMRILWLHRETEHGHGGDRRSENFKVPHGTLKIGFNEAIAQTGIPRRTAWRWMNGAVAMLARIGEFPEDANIEVLLPEPGSEDWRGLEAALKTAAQGVSLRRLLMGSETTSSDECRYDELIHREEAEDAAAAAALDAVADGKLTLVQAMRAAAGAAATKGKERRDPVYLEYDFAAKAPVGLVPKAFVTLKNAFERWEEFDGDAREAARDVWIGLLKAAPVELTNVLRGATGGRDSR